MQPDPSPLELQVADVLRRARRLPIGAGRNIYTSLRPDSCCCVGTEWTRWCRTAGRQCWEALAVKPIVGLNRASRQRER